MQTRSEFLSGLVKLIPTVRLSLSNNVKGFAPDDDSKPRVTLKNIQQRLEIMCGGSLMITSNHSEGTVVTIPDNAAARESAENICIKEGIELFDAVPIPKGAQDIRWEAEFMKNAA